MAMTLLSFLLLLYSLPYLPTHILSLFHWPLFVPHFSLETCAPVLDAATLRCPGNSAPQTQPWSWWGPPKQEEA